VISGRQALLNSVRAKRPWSDRSPGSQAAVAGVRRRVHPDRSAGRGGDHRGAARHSASVARPGEGDGSARQLPVQPAPARRGHDGVQYRLGRIPADARLYGYDIKEVNPDPSGKPLIRVNYGVLFGKYIGNSVSVFNCPATWRPLSQTPTGPRWAPTVFWMTASPRHSRLHVRRPVMKCFEEDNRARVFHPTLAIATLTGPRDQGRRRNLARVLQALADAGQGFNDNPASPCTT